VAGAVTQASGREATPGRADRAQKRLREQATTHARLQEALARIAQRNALREKLTLLGTLPALAMTRASGASARSAVLDQAKARTSATRARRGEEAASGCLSSSSGELAGRDSGGGSSDCANRVGGHRSAEKDLAAW